MSVEAHCMALSDSHVNGYWYGVAFAPDQAQAEQLAVGFCGDHTTGCTVRHSICNPEIASGDTDVQVPGDPTQLEDGGDADPSQAAPASQRPYVPQTLPQLRPHQVPQYHPQAATPAVRLPGAVSRPQASQVFKPQVTQVFKPQGRPILKPQVTQVFRPQGTPAYRPASGNLGGLAVHNRPFVRR